MITVKSPEEASTRRRAPASANGSGMTGADEFTTRKSQIHPEEKITFDSREQALDWAAIELLSNKAKARLLDLQADQQARAQLAGGEDIDLGLIPFGELDDTPLRYRVDGILLHQGLLLISGPAKIGKTTFIFELIDCLHAGKPFLGLETKRCADRIVYLNLEMPQSLVRHYAVKMSLPLTSPSILVSDLNGRGGKLGLLNEKSRAQLADQLRKVKTEVLIIDPLSALTAMMPDANSNDNDLMRRVLEAIKALAAEAGIDLVIVIDHTGHEATSRARGASAKQDTPDMLWAIEPNNDVRQLTVNGRIDKPGQVLGFRLNTVSHRLGQIEITDQNDDTIEVVKYWTTHPDESIRAIAAATGVSKSTVGRVIKGLKT